MAAAVLLSTAACWAQVPTAPSAAMPSNSTMESSTTSGATPITSGFQMQNPFLGSVPTGKATSQTLQLTLLDALDRGLKYNLGLLLSDAQTETARGLRWKALSDLLPKVTTNVSMTAEEINLQAFGFSIPGQPPVVGPFGVFDARGAVSETAFDAHALNNKRSAEQGVRAATFTYHDARELVVLAVGGTYLQAVAAQARVETVQAQLDTAQALFQRATDMKNNGVVAGIDVLRAQVEMQAQQQRLVAARNDFAKSKLTLARAIGLPIGQPFALAEKLPFEPPPSSTLDEALDQAYRLRNDYQSAIARVRAAELDVKAARGERLPTLQINGDYGLICSIPGNARQTFTAAVGVKLPIFQGGKVRADVMQAEASLRERQAQSDDLRGRIEFEVRTAFMDVQAAADEVRVAQQSVQLAGDELQQSQDRFAAGVTGNLEVVQAQQAVAAANENYIASLNAHNVAKLLLARSLGVAEKETRNYLATHSAQSAALPPPKGTQ